MAETDKSESVTAMVMTSFLQRVDQRSHSSKTLDTLIGAKQVNEHKLVEITINTVDHQEPKGKITYDRVVALAYPDFAQFPNATYSIIFERGHAGTPQGTLTKGGSVEIVEGIRFRVKRTGES
jgi:Multiubiquitin